MSAAASRGDRRRRVLNEEVLAASREQPSHQGHAADKVGPSRRYVLTSGHLSHALVNQVFPRSHWTTVATIALMTMVAGLLTTAHLFQQQIASFSSPAVASLANYDDSRAVATWLRSGLLLVGSLVAAAIFAARKHRADDFKGTYRRWKAVVLACGCASLCTSTRLHEVLASLAATSAGLAWPAQQSLWWIVPTAGAGTWLAFRMTKELAESRVSLLLFGLSLVSLATAVVATAVAESGVLVPSYLVVVSGLAGPMLLLATMIAYARHIAAQTLGHVAVATVRLADQTLAPAKRIAKVEPNDKAAEDSSEESSESSPAIRRAPVEWTDGSDADDEQADESRKLSKAERKKQRRAQQQQQRRAA